MKAAVRGRLRAGAAALDVTPARGCRMQGYEMRLAEEIADPLLVCALAVGADRVDWLLVTVDCIGLDLRFTRRARTAIAAALSMPAEAITIACSHTHSGPATLAVLGDVEGDAAYLAMLERRMCAAATTAAERRTPVTCRFGITSLPQNVNRRVRRNGRVELGVDPHGPVDSRLRILSFDRHDGSSLALVVHYACHATASGGLPHISADWPGAMRDAVQMASFADSPPVVCFLQGCAGDVTHRIGRDRDMWPDHFGQHTAVESGVLGRLTASAALAACEHAYPVHAETVAVVTQPLTLAYHHRLGSEQTELQMIRLGPLGETNASHAVWFVALPGEPFASYGTAIGERLRGQLAASDDHILVCGYTNDTPGYLATARALHEGGYEVTRAHALYGRRVPFAASTERRVLAQASRAAAQLRPASSYASLIDRSLVRLGELLSFRS